MSARTSQPVVPAVGDHLRAVSDAHPPGVYRVVGTGERTALLRVTDADGRRIHTGELCRVPTAALETAFEPAPDPDAGLRPLRALRNAAQGLYWNVRKFA